MKEVRDEAVLEVQQWTNEIYGEHLIACGYGLVDETGHTSWDTVYGLIIGLQVELGVSDANLAPSFGPTTIGLLNAYGNISEGVNDENGNINQILKGGCLSTGYYPGYFDNEFDQYLTSAIKELQRNIGINDSGIVDTKTFKALLTMNSYVLLSGGSTQVREFQQWLNKTYGNKSEYYYYPCDGLYSRGCQEAIVYGIQYECGLDSVANGWFGPTTQENLKNQGQVALGDVDGATNFVHLFKGSFLCNNLDSYAVFNGIYSDLLYLEVKQFQEFLALDVNGNGDYPTWCELLVSTGDATRKTKALDCSIEKVTNERAIYFKEQGYETIGRYLTNEGGTLDKKLEQFEIDAIFEQNMSIFPIYQTYHHLSDHFNYVNGQNDALDAFKVAEEEYGIPSGTTIYFPVDYDAYDYEVEDSITQYFLGVLDTSNQIGNKYNIGIYGSRNTCSIISNKGLAKYSFVSGMSIGFSGNLGFTMPTNWSFNQIYEDAELGIDNDVKSGLDEGFNYQTLKNINAEFLSELSTVYNKAKEFWESHGSNDIENDIIKSITSYYRYPDYIGEGFLGNISFDVMFGNIRSEDEDFIQQMLDFIPEENRKKLYDPISKEVIDVDHLFATISGNITHDLSIDENLTLGDFGGWLGDLCSVIPDYYNEKHNPFGLTISEWMDSKVCAPSGEHSYYGADDYYADRDAINIYTMFRNNITDSILYIFESYYNKSFENREQLFLENRCNNDTTYRDELTENVFLVTPGISLVDDAIIWWFHANGKDISTISAEDKDQFIEGYNKRQQEKLDLEKN